MNAVSVKEHGQAVSGSKQAQPPLEKGGELAVVGGKERALGGASKMAASSDADSWSRGTLEERQLGATSKMAVTININEEDVVVISDEEEEVQRSTSRGAGGGLYRAEEELLDYDDGVDEELLPMQRGDVMKSRAVPSVVQGDHSGAHRQELVACNLPRGYAANFSKLRKLPKEYPCECPPLVFSFFSLGEKAYSERKKMTSQGQIY
ncbi:hypothetical protein NDU88_005229 [Pleurodeles waltl]|uniref:Uncharacterized protein n=1 Tax=Pleurodeles waltl TaxID=8319 RepID=A0AAV7W7H0_PLEWA|nr:hypothetical protein NDU88_005229 [Pleurodeles waltl]